MRSTTTGTPTIRTPTADCPGPGRAPSSPGQQAGFTLLEVLIAVTITAVIGIGVSQLLSSVIAAKDGIDRVSEEFVRLQQAVVVLERDLAQIVFRPIRDIYGDPVAAVTTRADPYAIGITRTGWRNPLQAARSDLQRVAYEVGEEEKLVRYYWDVLDRAQDTVPREQELLEGVTELNLRFLDHDRNWSDEWPSDTELQSMSPDDADGVLLPLAVEFEIEHERFGRIRRLIDLGDFDPELFAMGTGVPDPDPDGESDQNSGAEQEETRETGESNVNPEAPAGNGADPQ